MTEPAWIVRPVEPSDIDQVFGLIVELAEYQRARKHVSSTPSMLRDALFPADGRPFLWGHVAVATDANPDSDSHDTSSRIVGMMLWFLNYSTWDGTHGIHIEDLYVQPHTRGTGVGKKLLAAVAQICVDRHYGRVELAVLKWNSPTISFYQQCGGIQLDEWDGYRFEPTQLLAKTL